MTTDAEQSREVKKQPVKTPGQIAFEAYNNAGENPWLTFKGEPVPRWGAISDDVRVKWEAAADTIATQVHGALVNHLAGLKLS